MSTLADVDDVLRSNDALVPIQNLVSLHHDLPVLIASLLGAPYNSELYSELERRLTPEGSVRGRSKQRVPTVDTPEELSVEYVRPNGEKYYSRKWGLEQDVLVLRNARTHKKSPYFYGVPGTGKTALCEAAFGDELLTIVMTGDTEVTDLVGSFVPNPDYGQPGEAEFIWVDGDLLIAVKEGRPILIDEIGLGDPKVLSILYGLMDGRNEINVTANPNIGTVKAADGFFVIGASNPNAPGYRMSEALLSRFPIHVEMTTDWELAKRLGAPQKLITVAKNLDGKAAEGMISWSPQMRELLAYRDLKEVFSEAFAIKNLLATCPENDRAVVREVVNMTWGETITPAKI